MRFVKPVVVFAFASLFLAQTSRADIETCEREFRSGSLIVRLDQITLTGLAASQLDGTENPKLKSLLVLQLASAAEGARVQVEGGAVLPKDTMPNLVEGVKRARDYASSERLKTVMADLDVILASLPLR